MPRDRPNTFSSAFDAVLDRNRQELEALYTGSQSSFEHTAGTPRAASVESVAPSVAPRPSTVVRLGTFDASGSPAARELDRRYGGDWRYELAEQLEVDGEIIVLCKLKIGNKNIIRSQYGSRRIDDTPDAGGGPVSGAADGVHFALATDGTTGREAGQSSGGARQAAFQRAVEQALGRCAEML